MSAIQPKLSTFNPQDRIDMILEEASVQIEKTIKEVANDLHNATRETILQAARQAYLLTASLKIAYSDKPNLTYGNASSNRQNNIRRLDAIVTDITKKADKALDKLADQIQEIINASPLKTQKIPLLLEQTPAFFAVDSVSTPTKASVTFQGDFHYANTQGFNPAFLFNNQSYTPTSSSKEHLKFDLEIPKTIPEQDKHSFIGGTLSIPSKQGLLGNWVTSEYHVNMGMFPSSVGNFRVIYTILATTRTKTFYSDEIILVSKDSKHIKTAEIVLKPHDGWSVIRDTAKFVFKTEGVPIKAEIVSDANNQVRCKYENGKTSGRLQFQFDEITIVPASQREEAINNLGWGNSITLAHYTGEVIKEIQFVSFNGETTVFQPRTNVTNAFITLTESSTGIQIKAKSASEINETDLTDSFVEITAEEVKSEGNKEIIQFQED